ncbi:hypothetical protein JCM15519_02770 [Fundidesulfovibrio butyratiphilus]
MRAFRSMLVLVALWLAIFLVIPGTSRAQTNYLECTACQLFLSLIDASAPGDGQVVVDASHQCALLPPGDREACTKFYATYGPKMVKAIKHRRAKGESLDQICRAMSYCQ